MPSIPQPLLRLRDRILSIGARATDEPGDRLRKEALVLTAVIITVLASVWTVTYLLFGLPLSAAVPLAYQVVSVVSLAWFARTGDFSVLRLAQIGLMLLLPFALQWTLGGFEASSAVMIWAFAAPLGALVFYGPRRAVLVFAGYMALAVLSGVIDPWLPQPANPIPEPLRLLFFVLNIAGVSVVTYAVLQYFVAERERAQTETETLLHSILPRSIADRLRSGAQLIANEHPEVTVLFADIAGFTPLARSAGPAEIVTILNRVFSAFDALAERHGLEKIKTIGDAYMAAAGAPEPRPDHVRVAADMALEMLDEIRRCAHDVGRPLELRIGMHTGHAVAGVIGRRKFAYDLWGDAVNVASRMESHGVAGRIHVTDAVREALQTDYVFEERGSVEIKGLGEMRTWFLVGDAPPSSTSVRTSAPTAAQAAAE